MPARVDLGAATERTLSTLTGSLNATGDAVRDAGAALRDRLRDGARAVERGGRALRANGVRGAATATAQGAQRHKKTILGTAGAMAGGLLALRAMRRARAKNGIRWPWRR